MSNSIQTAVLDQYNTAAHSVIKQFVLEADLTENQRLARIAVIHAVLDAPDQSLGAYTKALLDILTEGQADYSLAAEAVAAVAHLRVSNLAIITDFRLNEYGESLIHDIATAVAVVTPERFMPMKNCERAPDFSDFTTMNITGDATVKTPLVKNRMFHKRATSPKLFEAMDRLWSQQYALNEDIMALKNLPAEFSCRQFALGALPAFADTFSFRFTLDSRGRVYARSLLVQPQGDGFSKSVLNLGTKKALGAKGLNALAIHYANVSGMDKASLQERVEWARHAGTGYALRMLEADGDFMRIGDVASESLGLNVEDKDIFEMYAAACEWFRATTADDSSKYESALVCHQDATNSGFQFGAAILGDKATASSTNLLASHYSVKPNDLYQMVADSMIAQLDPTYTCRWNTCINRNSLKKVVMVTGYGAGKKTQIKNFCEGLHKIGADHMIDCVDEVVENALVAALEENASALLMLSAVMKGHAKEIDGQINWTTEDGFNVKHDYQEMEAYGTGKYKVVASHSAGLDEAKNASALPPNFVHSIDGNMLRKSAIKSANAGIAFVPIHDSFGTHACDFFNLGRLLREAFIETMRYEWYNNFCETNNVAPKLTFKREFDITEVRKSSYMFS